MGGLASPQALGKAMKRVHTALPSFPTEASLTFQSVGLDYLEMKTKMFDNLKGPNVLSEETERLIKDFYFKMDVVYKTPGLNDYMTVAVSGKRSILRKHYLTVYLQELFALFRKAYSE